MRSAPQGLAADSVVAALGAGWGFDAEAVEYAAVGAGSYHWEVADGSGRRRFVTVDDLEQKAWLGDARDVVFDGLGHAFDTAVALRAAGLQFVVAPLPAEDGKSLRRLEARHAISLFPFVDGAVREYGVYEDDDRQAIVAMLGELHGATPVVGSRARAVGLDLPGRQHLEAALRECDATWSGGPLSGPARAAVEESADELRELLALADRLAAEAKTRDGEWVVTHGEPHSLNVMRSGGRRFLVDWDTVALAPPERDLWMLVDDEVDIGALYAGATGRRPNEVALDFFRLTWDLKDFAEYLKLLRSPHEENDDTVRAYGAMTRCGALRETWRALLP